MTKISINSTLNERVSAFAKAGQTLTSFLNKEDGGSSVFWDDRIEESLLLANNKNPWFTRTNLKYALEQWSNALTIASLTDWLAPYHLSNITPRAVAIIAAGNVPLVGFHDVLSVILAGHRAIIKVSGNDDVLLPLLLDIAASHLNTIKDSFTFTKERLVDYDAVIATGSDNTARYFEYYFGKKPNIIRKNRNSIAVLSGDETLEDMVALSADVFTYFGLGCRSVSHLKVPHGYNFDLFFNGMYTKRDLINNPKYLNNYDYNKAVFLMSEFECLDNEFLIIKEEKKNYTSPIASLGYSFYNNLEDVTEEIDQNADQLQCVVSSANAKSVLSNHKNETPQFVNFGQTQQPSLSDYADGVDTLNFLLTLS